MPQEKASEEQVLVFPASVLDEFGRFQGLSFEVDRFLDLVFAQERWRFMPRCTVETDEAFKQLIPYTLFRYGSSTFAYRRSRSSGESRLIGDRSIGIGGHISTKDPNLFGDDPLSAGMQREVDEEVEIDSKFSSRLAALLNDDSNEVGRVHFGVISVISLVQPQIRKRDSSITESGFFSESQLTGQRDEFENWSKICIDHIGEFRWLPPID